MRQGCILSPLLYSIWINDLAVHINRRCAGVSVDAAGRYRLRLLLYADDIVLLAESVSDLQAAMTEVEQYARRWRFQVNPKKCAAMYFAPRPSTPNPVDRVHIDGVTIEWVDQYCYLGVEIQRSGRAFGAFKTRAERTARCALGSISGMGMYSGKLPVPTACEVYCALVRSQLEYAAEVWSAGASWDAAERIQLMAARRILGCQVYTSGDAIRGELGLMTLESRWLQLRLGFWLKLQQMNESDWPRRVLAATIDEYALTDTAAIPVIAADADEGWLMVRVRRAPTEHQTLFWCAQIQLDLYHTGYSALWRHSAHINGNHQDWQAKIRSAAQRREAQRWWLSVQQQSSLSTYVRLRHRDTPFTHLTRASYFNVPHGGWNDQRLVGRRLMTRLRLGVSDLRISTGRRENELRHHRHCICCTQGIEDEEHLLLHCSFYDDLRVKLFDSIDAVINADDYFTSVHFGIQRPAFAIRSLSTLDRLKLLMCELINAIVRCHKHTLVQMQSRILEQLPKWLQRRDEFVSDSAIDNTDTTPEANT